MVLSFPVKKAVLAEVCETQSIYQKAMPPVVSDASKHVFCTSVNYGRGHNWCVPSICQHPPNAVNRLLLLQAVYDKKCNIYYMLKPVTCSTLRE